MSYAATVAGALSRVSESVTLYALSGGTFDPATGSVTGETETTYTVGGVFTSYDTRLIDGSTIRSGDLKCLVASEGLTFTPSPGDTLERNGARLEIVNARELFLAGTVAWELQVRGNA